MMRKRKSIKGQLTLPYSRAARFAILRAAVFTLPGRGPRAFRSVYELIEQIELCTFRDGCRVRQEVLAHKMRCCTATVSRATRLAVELKILRVENDHGNGGGMYRYRIDWNAIYRMCPSEVKKQQASEEADTEVVETTAAVPVEETSGETERTPTEWKSVEVSLRDCHVKGWAKAVAVARERGLTPGDCHGLINFALSRPLDYWTDRATAIYLRLTTSQRGQDLSEGWLPVSASFMRRDRVEREQVVRAAEDQKARYDAGQLLTERAKRSELEGEFGLHLDRMSRAEADAFARRIFADNPVMLALYKRKGRAGLVRLTMLESMRKESHVAAQM